MNTPFRLGLSTACKRELTEKLFTSYAQAGIFTMEISLDPHSYPEIPWNDCQKWARETGVEIWSLHMPFYPFEQLNPASSDPGVRKHTIAYFGELMKKAASIGCRVAVVHPSGEPIAKEARREALECAKDTFAKLAELAAKEGVTVAVENLPRTCLGKDSADLLELLSADSRLRTCFDTNHLLKQPIVEYINLLGSRMITLHVSDYDFKNERHWMPGEGNIHWQELLAALKEVNYQGPFLYEVNFMPERTIRRRPLDFSDIRANYDILMRGETPAPIGEPISEMCLE